MVARRLIGLDKNMIFILIGFRKTWRRTMDKYIL